MDRAGRFVHNRQGYLALMRSAAMQALVAEKAQAVAAAASRFGGFFISDQTMSNERVFGSVYPATSEAWEAVSGQNALLKSVDAARG